ncbi:hypothetical protein AAVH_11633 [Aphelenchoides avenae]|nr:hypothetical protein AAVH_11633 [Aphelenchus avenae]
MTARSRFASLLAIVAFLYVIIVLSKLNNPMPPDGHLIVASLYTVALLSEGSFMSTLPAVLTVPFCVTTVHADYAEKDYYRVKGPGDWNSPDALSDTISIDEAGKITIRMSNMKDSVTVTLAVDVPFDATVRLSQPDHPPAECKEITVNLGKDCAPTWNNELAEAPGGGQVQLGFEKVNIYLPKQEPNAILKVDIAKSSVEGKAITPVQGMPSTRTWGNTCGFVKVGTFNVTKSVIILGIAPVQSSACVMSMELDSNTYLLLENKYLPTTTVAITTLGPTNTTHGTNFSSSTPSEGPKSGNNDADRANIGVIVGASCGALLILILIGIAVTIVCVRRRGKKRQPKKYQEEGQYHGIDSLNQSTVNKSSQADKSKKEKTPEPVAPPHGPRCTTDANGYEVIFPATPPRGSPKNASTPPQDNSTKNPQAGTQNGPAAEGM